MSNYKINDINLDNYFELRTGRTPLASETGYKVNGIDLNDRYLSRSHGSAVGGPDINLYTAAGVDLSSIFSAKIQNAVSSVATFDAWSATSKVATFTVDYYSSMGRDNNYLYGGILRINLNVFGTPSGSEASAFSNLFSLHQPIRYTKTGSFNFYDVNTGGIYYDNTTTSLQTVDGKSGSSGTSYLIHCRKLDPSLLEIKVTLSKGSSVSLSNDIIVTLTSYNHPVIPTITLVSVT